MSIGTEQSLQESMPEFGMDQFGMTGDFGINAAFQEAMHGVAGDAELALDEKVRRMEVMITEGTSETYRDFVDLRQMAAQMEMICNQDHGLNESMQNSGVLNGFMDSHKPDDGHNHAQYAKKQSGKDEYEIDPKTGKKTKKKKRKSWFGVYV